MKIVIIDSGIDFSLVSNNCKCLDGVSIFACGESFSVNKSCEDELGHGTAVADILTTNIQGEYDLFVVKVFTSDFYADNNNLYWALDYIDKYIDCEMILISSGVRSVDDVNNMEMLIDKLVQKKVIIVSAFDNNGAMSYPAAFHNVIGVDSSSEYKKDNQFAVIENNGINILAGKVSYRVRGIDGKINIVKGNSFTTAYIGAIIADYIIEYGDKVSFWQCINYLKSKAVCILGNKIKEPVKDEKFFRHFNKAIVFPFNKETQAVAKFEEMLDVEIIGYYDIKYSGLLGSKISDVFGFIENSKIIRDYQEIPWDGSFDSVILGHTDVISKLLGKNLKHWFIEKCRRYNKKIYCFDDIQDILDNRLRKNQFFFPVIRESMVPDIQSGKLYLVSRPVLGVYGTSSKQGKYTLQLMLRKIFLKKGFSVSQVGTEPSGYLFGFDFVYPMGYNSTVYVSGMKAVAMLNDMMRLCERNNADIIITGCQSGTVPMVNYNLKYFTLPQVEFILGTQPDLVVLCINLHDTIQYIKRTKNFIESICDCKVIAFCLYPDKIVKNNGFVKRHIKVEGDECKIFINKLKEEFNIPVYKLNELESIDELSNRIIEILS